MSNFSEYFDQLSSRNEATRRSGVEHLIEFLLSNSSHQITYRNSTAFEYCLQRLVKGLSAYTAPTLHGFVTSLICLLDSIDDIIPHVYDLIEKHLVPPPHAKSSEVKGYRIGQLLALSAVSRCTNFSTVESDLKTTIMRRISFFLRQDDYLQTASTQTISDYILHISNEELRQLLPLLTDTLPNSLDTCSPESLSLLFSLYKSFPRYDLTSTGMPRLDSVEHLPAITDILLTTVSATNSPHPAILFAIDFYQTGELFHNLWMLLVEEGTFELELSRKCIVLDLLIYTIRSDPPLRHLFSILSPRVICFFKSSLRTDRELLHSRGVQTAAAIVSIIQNRGVATHTIAALRLLLFSKSVSQDLYAILKEAIPESEQQYSNTLDFIHSLFQYFLEGSSLIPYPQFLSPLSSSTSSILASQEYTLGLLTHLSKLSECINSQVEEAIIKFLVTHSYFHMVKSSKSFYPPCTQLNSQLSEDIRTKCQQTLLLILTDFLPNDTRKIAYFPQLGFAAKWAISLLDKSKHVTPVSQRLDSNILRLLEDVRTQTLEIENVLEEEAECRVRSLILSFIQYHTVILFSNPSSSTRSTLSKLLDCYHSLSQNSETLFTGEMSVSELIAEIVSTLSHNSHLSRSLSHILFRCLIPYMTRHALLLLADAAFSSPTLDLASESEDEGETSGSESEVSSQADSSEGENAANGDVSLEERDIKFKLEVSSALGEGNDTSGAESLDMDQDEERLKKIDLALGQLFRKKLKTENPTRVKRRREISSLHYRTRVLALIQTFIEKRPDSPLLLYLVVPASECLLIVSKKRELSDLSSKLSSLYTHKLCRAKCKLTDTSPTLPCTLLKRLFHLALSAHSLELARMISEGIGMLLKTMRRAGMLVECAANLVENLEEFLNLFAAKKNGYQWNLPFLKLIEFAPHIASNLVPKLIDLINSSVYKFQTRKCEEILQNIIQSSDCREPIQSHLSQLHSFYIQRLASIPSIENAHHCQTSLHFMLPYCQLLSKCRYNSTEVEAFCEEMERMVGDISESERVGESQRLNRLCSSLAESIKGERKGRRANRKRNRESRVAPSPKKIKHSSP